MGSTKFNWDPDTGKLTSIQLSKGDLKTINNILDKALGRSDLTDEQRAELVKVKQAINDLAACGKISAQ